MVTLRMESAVISYHPNADGSGSHGASECTWTIHCPRANEQVALSFQALQTEEQVRDDDDDDGGA